jgi:hypothetical protein
MNKIQALRDKHGLAVMHVAQHGAEVNTGWTAVEVSKILVANHYRAVEAVNSYMSRIQDRSSSDLVACISDRD